MTRGILVTADGEVFEGRAVGSEQPRVGEVIFNTSMTGYQEVLSDPSYAGQIIVMTSPHIGNYGISDHDDQAAAPAAQGLIVRALSRRHSNWRSEGSLAEYLHRHRVGAIADIDTRRLTRHIRDNGSMPVAIGVDVDVSELKKMAEAAPHMVGQDLVTTVTTAQPYQVSPPGDPIGRVVALDLGMKRDIVRQLTARGLEVHVVPAATPATEIRALEPSGVFLSNGPGDPEPLERQVATVRQLLGAVPMFGICLGHQVLGLALGATTYKMGFGHHGGNHPVKNLADGRVAITAQNHGFSVDLWSLTDEVAPSLDGLPTPGLLPDVVSSQFGDVRPTHQNLNDGTLEGMACADIPAFSVQYHPEAAPGPRDAVGLFDDFCDLMGLQSMVGAS